MFAVGLGVLAGRWFPTGSRGASHGAASEDLKRLDDSLSALEQRLLADQARVGLWQELRDRHETVTQVACENLTDHARSIAAVEQRDRDQARASRRSRLAAADTYRSTAAP